MINDVYMREVRAKPIMNKRPETVNAAMRELLPTLVEDNTNYTISTDFGKEFSRLDQGGIPASAVHRLKEGKTPWKIMLGILLFFMYASILDKMAAWILMCGIDNWYTYMDTFIHIFMSNCNGMTGV